MHIATCIMMAERAIEECPDSHHSEQAMLAMEQIKYYVFDMMATLVEMNSTTITMDGIEYRHSQAEMRQMAHDALHEWARAHVAHPPSRGKEAMMSKQAC